MMGIVLAIAGVQLRLLANVIDGLVAVEGGKSTALGALYNEFPDRIADSIILIAFGYGVQLSPIGWLAALLAALTAYIRVFGGALGQIQSFSGPMAKQHRMAAVTLGLIAMLVGAAGLQAAACLYVAQGALWAIVVGSAWTCWRRTRAIAEQLVAR
ncbi:CDP-alcohol phosphatidyltransferase family protein [Uliginosibacterium sp. sgz301328]|uniref:CDP-alcohol phosphatidyltransferase family protein n=1 Tax=Uliginosibacterium sp. sgz301328 TaxID=3243764 RepID=UPI00359EFAB2